MLVGLAKVTPSRTSIRTASLAAARTRSAQGKKTSVESALGAGEAVAKVSVSSSARAVGRDAQASVATIREYEIARFMSPRPAPRSDALHAAHLMPGAGAGR